ncbi:MAG: glycosyltransferase [Alphaproteobacteria bacterium]|nr:glycosyltransferase [Alphaproteobacteria bacterium]
MTEPKLISAVVPVRDEAGNIAPLIAEIARALAPIGAYEIVYVDDGSADGTLDALRRAAAAMPALTVLRHRQSCGQSAALLTGIGAARGEWIVTLDGDGQNDPADIANLVAARDAALRGDPAKAAVMVCGRRAKRRDTALRRVSSRVANGVRAAALGDRTADTGCSLKLFRRADFLAMPWFDHMHRFLPALMLRQGGRVVSVDVNHRPRLSGRSNYGLFDRLWVGIVDLLGVMWLMRRARLPAVERIAGLPANDRERP